MPFPASIVYNPDMSRIVRKRGAMEERYLSLGEACEVLGKSERTLYRWIKSGKLRAYKPGRDYEIPVSAIEEMREKSVVRPKAPTPPRGEERRGTVYRYPDEPKVTAEQLRARGIEVNDSEVSVLNQYLAIHENPPTGIHVIAHVVKEGEPVDHERVRGILLYLIAKDLLPPEETEAVAENMRRELAGTSA